LPVRLDDPRGGRQSDGGGHGSGDPRNGAGRQPWAPGDGRYSRPADPRYPGAPRYNSGPVPEPETRTLRVREPQTQTLRVGKTGQTRIERRVRKRRIRAVPVVAVASAFVVMAAAGTTAYYRLGPGRPGGNGAAAAFSAIGGSKTLAALEAEHQVIVEMNSATVVMSSTSKVSGVSPASVESAVDASDEQATQEETIASGELSPSAAMEVAQELMPDYGFSVSSQWSCLDDIWTQESDWEWDAENTSSGAYGIAQALPADQMSSVGDDWATDATTQIKWGLGYIEERYGTPCGAWDHEVDDGWY
jgi:hypothetical protein